MDSDKSKKPEKSAASQSCTLCQELQITSKPFITCTKCYNPTCKSHMKSVYDLFFCDACIKQDLKSLVLQDHQASLTSITNELNSYKEREDIYLSRIETEQKKITSIQHALESTKKNSEAKSLELNKKIYEQELINQSDEMMKKSFESELVEVEKSIQEKIAKCSENQSEMLKASNSLSQTEKVVKSLKTQVQTLAKDCTLSIPYRRLRNTVCLKCHKELKIKMRDAIFSALQEEDSVSLIESLYKNRSLLQERQSGSPCSCASF